MRRHVGYARTSTRSQDISLQVEALTEHGCDPIFEDHGRSGCSMNRPGLAALYEALQPGDCLMIWRLDRLSRDRDHLRQIEADTRRLGVTIRTIADFVDTSTLEGKVRFDMAASLADAERCIQSQRIRNALARRAHTARGRPLKLSHEHVAEIRERLRTEDVSRAEIAASYDISYRTLARYLQA